MITPETEHYWLTNIHIPTCLIDNYNCHNQTREGLCLVDLEINQGIITQITTASEENKDIPLFNLGKSLVFPCFVDVHTHLDKGHIWQRAPNLEGNFANAITTVKEDSQKYWQSEDVYRRMEFGLKCSYVHGTKAIRTHIDCFGQQATINLGVFQQLQQKWQDRITLQAVSLVSLDYFQTSEGIALADKIAAVGGILKKVIEF